MSASLWSEVDLHLHTTASDGRLTPEQVVALAHERGVRVIALTDHDSTGGVDAALAAARGKDVEVIPGVELNTDVPAGEAHVLGYYLDHHQPVLEALLEARRRARFERGAAMVEKLRALGFKISWERVQELAGAADGGAVGRPHVARALMEQGYVGSVNEAFEKYLGRDGPAYVSYARFTPEEAVRAVADARGVPVLAHPPTWPGYEEALPSLIGAGLAGLECYYGQLKPAEVQPLLDTAARHNLIITGGSDFHGSDGPLIASLGVTQVPMSCVLALKEQKRTIDARLA